MSAPSVVRRIASGATIALACCALAACRRDAAVTGAQTAVEPPLAARPMRIVPATTAAAEYLVLLVDPLRLAALPDQVDDFSADDFQSGQLGKLPRYHDFTAERVLAQRPDFVVAHAWQSQDTISVLRGRGTPLLVLRSASSWDDVRGTLEAIAAATGDVERAKEVERSLDARIAALAERARGRRPLRALVYSNDGTGGWAAGARTTADTLLRMVGLHDAGAEDGIDEHKQIDFERVLRIDPDLFVVGRPARGEGGSATRAVLTSTPALGTLRAVKDARIVEISSPLLSADSPRILDAAEALDRALSELDARK